MFSIMFKFGDFFFFFFFGGGGVDDIFVVCIQICSGGPCRWAGALGKTSNAQ